MMKDRSADVQSNDGEKSGWLIAAEISFALLVGGGLLAAVGAEGYARSNKSEHWALFAMLVVALPTLFTFAALLTNRGRSLRKHELLSPVRLEVAETAEGQWLVPMVQQSWQYERIRYRATLDKTGVQALIFGLMVTLTVGVAFLMYSPEVRKPTAPQDAIYAWQLSNLVAVAVATAGVTAFVLHTVAILVRLSNQDFNARMYAHATRSLVLTICAAAAGAVLFARPWEPGPLIGKSYQAFLFGALVGIVGDRAIDWATEKLGMMFGVEVAPAKRSSDITGIEGLGPEDVARMAEEGIQSLHALAYVPTARLFFSTNHSLQRLVDWQDQALLRVQVGLERAEILRRKLGVRGARDLLMLAKRVQPEGKEDNPLRVELAGALDMSSAQFSLFLDTFRHEDVALRISLHSTAIARIADGNSPTPTNSFSNRALAKGELELRKSLDEELGKALLANPSVDATSVFQDFVRRLGPMPVSQAPVEVNPGSATSRQPAETSDA